MHNIRIQLAEREGALGEEGAAEDGFDGTEAVDAVEDKNDFTCAGDTGLDPQLGATAPSQAATAESLPATVESSKGAAADDGASTARGKTKGTTRAASATPRPKRRRTAQATSESSESSGRPDASLDDASDASHHESSESSESSESGSAMSNRCGVGCFSGVVSADLTVYISSSSLSASRPPNTMSYSSSDPGSTAASCIAFFHSSAKFGSRF